MAMAESLNLMAIPMLFLKIHSNTIVGGIQSVSGLASMLTSFPASWLADKHGRALVLKIGNTVDLVFLVTTLVLFAVFLHAQNFGALVILLAVEPVIASTIIGTIHGAFDAISAESVESTKLSEWFTNLMVARMVARGVGGAMGVLLIWKIGDHWALNQIIPILISSQIVYIISGILTYRIRDVPPQITPSDQEMGEIEGSQAGVEMLRNDQLAADTDRAPMEDVPLEGAGRPSLGSTLIQKITGVLGFLIRKRIPFCMFTYNFIFVLGSGMSVKFFPLFFQTTYSLSPMQLQTLLSVSPIIAAAIGQGFKRLTSTTRRPILVISVFDLLGTMCTMFMLIFVSNKWAVFVSYLFRGGLLLATYPLHKSIIMNNVPENERARWNSLDSIMAFGWAGSAAAGGVIADRWAYTSAFAITSCIHVLAVAFLVVTLGKTPLRPEQKNKTPE